MIATLKGKLSLLESSSYWWRYPAVCASGYIYADIEGIVEITLRAITSLEHLLGTQEEMLCQYEIIHAE
jgi:hypothetical protein